MNRFEHSNTIRQLIIDRTPNNWIRSRPKFLGSADRIYWIPRFNQLNTILQRCPIAHHDNRGELFDCDDYAMTFKSRLAFLTLREPQRTGSHPIAGGVFWGRASWSPDLLHAGNWFVTREDQLVWIEPQYNNRKFRNSPQPKPAIRPQADTVTHLQLMIF